MCFDLWRNSWSQQQLETLSRCLNCFITGLNANFQRATFLEIKGHPSATYIVMSCFNTRCFKWLNKYHMPIMRLCYCCLNLIRELFSKCYSLQPTENSIHLHATFFFFLNLCLYWQVSSPDQQTLNMTPLNGHILTPKIHHALSGLSRRREAVLGTLGFQELQPDGRRLSHHNLPEHILVHTLWDIRRQTRWGRGVSGVAKYPGSYRWSTRCQPWPAVGAAWLRLSLLSPLAGPTRRNKEWEPVWGAGVLELITGLTAGSLSAAGLALCTGGKRKRVSG